MTVCVASWVVVVNIAFRAPDFLIDYTLELCLWCLFSDDFVDARLPAAKIFRQVINLEQPD